MLENTELLSRVEAILEKSRKIREEGLGTGPELAARRDHESHSGPANQPWSDSRLAQEQGGSRVSKGQIFAAMMSPPIVIKYSERSEFAGAGSSNYSQPEYFSRGAGKVAAVDADLISLAARYSGDLETSASLGYKQKVELEELESRKNDLKMRSDFLQKKLESESARLLEREISFSKVAKERDALLKNLHHLASELEKMTSGSEETIGELREASQRVCEDQEAQRELFAEITLSIEREKEEFLEEIRDDFEELQREKLDELARTESDISLLMNESRSVEFAMTELKNSLAHEMKAVIENTAREEQGVFAAAEHEALQRVSEAARATEELKAAEADLRRQLHGNSSKLEETKQEASKYIGGLKASLHEVKKELQALRAEKARLEAAFRKKEAGYGELYEQVKGEQEELQQKAVAAKNEHDSLVRGMAEETRQVEEHIESGKQRLEKLHFAIGEFAQESEKLKAKNEKNLENLRMGLDSLVKGLAHG